MTLLCNVFVWFLSFFCRQLQDFKGDKCKCAKLFAKHMKVKELIHFLTGI